MAVGLEAVEADGAGGFPLGGADAFHGAPEDFRQVGALEAAEQERADQQGVVDVEAGGDDVVADQQLHEQGGAAQQFDQAAAEQPHRFDGGAPAQHQHEAGGDADSHGAEREQQGRAPAAQELHPVGPGALPVPRVMHRGKGGVQPERGGREQEQSPEQSAGAGGGAGHGRPGRATGDHRPGAAETQMRGAGQRAACKPGGVEALSRRACRNSRTPRARPSISFCW